MRKLTLLMLVAAFTIMFNLNAKASSYIANDNLIDEMFSMAPETVNASLSNFALTGFSSSAVTSSDDTAIVAILLDIFLGGLGIHRLYLGTEILTVIAYPLTCGGIFGVVPFVDFIVLIINYEDVSKFKDNPKFFMWL